MGFAENLKKARRSRGLSQDVMCWLLSVDKSTYAAFESGKRLPDVQKIKEIAGVLEESVEDLMGTSEETKRRMRAYGRLSEDALKIAKRFDEASPLIRSIVASVLAAGEAASPEDAEAAPHSVQRSDGIVPLLGSGFDSGAPSAPGEMFMGDYSSPDPRAEFALYVYDDTMEPYLKSGSIALGVKRKPHDGEVAACFLDGVSMIRQYHTDDDGTVRLFTLNRTRSNLDETIPMDSHRDFRLIGVILLSGRPPLPEE